MYTLFATAVYRPGHGSLSPLAMGLTVFVATVAGVTSLTAFIDSLNHGIVRLER